MVLWVDKHRPSSIDALDTNTQLNNKLKQIAANVDSFPHLMFYGTSGAGKKTRINAVLRELYGPGVEKVKAERQVFKIKAGERTKVLELTTVSSNYHIEMTPSDVGINDRLVIQEVIKSLAQTHNLDAQTQKEFKVIVLNEVDNLTKDAQHALRRTMEKYVSTCRIIMRCESACKVIEPLRSRCLGIRIPAPSHAEIRSVLLKVAKLENIKLPEAFAKEISLRSDRNLRKAILMLEASKVERYPFEDGQQVRIADWERFIEDIARSISEEQSPQRLLQIRGKIYELLTNCVPPSLIIKTLADCLLKRVDSSLMQEIIQAAAFYEHRVVIGSKSIMHIEGFIAKTMALQKEFLVQLLDGM